jgi:hypothetical protein
MEFTRRDAIRSKIVISNKITEQIDTHTVTQDTHCYAKKKKYVAIKLTKVLLITGTISEILKPSKIQKQTRLQIYNTPAIPTVLYDSDTWTLRSRAH